MIVRDKGKLAEFKRDKRSCVLFCQEWKGRRIENTFSMRIGPSQIKQLTEWLEDEFQNGNTTKWKEAQMNNVKRTIGWADW